MNRRQGLAALFALGWIPATRLAARDRVPRIGYLSLGSITETPSRERQAFLDGLRDFGLAPGKSVEMVYRSAEGEATFLRAMYEDLLRENVDVVATVGGRATLAAVASSRSVPIVFLALGDPVGIGVTDSVARPTRNATGTTFISSELAGKRIELLKLAVPAAKRVAFLWEQLNRNAQIEADSARATAESVGLSSRALPVNSQAELNAALARLAERPPDAMYVCFAAGVISANRTAIVEFGLRHRVPVISGWSFMTDAGGLLSYAPDVLAMFRRSAYYVARILDGASPAELPIEQATKIELVVNVDTARKLGLTLPPDLLLRADRVIE
ncbi:MAG: ABC transporter substrate-binding protein [bacterium]|jgi:putative ABC transport system substrate-binding protein